MRRHDGLLGEANCSNWQAVMKRSAWLTSCGFSGARASADVCLWVSRSWQLYWCGGRIRAEAGCSSWDQLLHLSQRMMMR